MGQSGMLFFCAAGNNRTNIYETPIYPASFGLDNTILAGRRGRVTRQTSSFDASGNAERIYTYDIAGNVLTELVKTDTDKYTKTGNEYDAWGNLTIMALFEGYLNADGVSLDGKGARNEKQRVKKVYNAIGQLTAVYDNATLKASYTYDLSGQLLTTANNNGTTETNTYNSAGLVTSNPTGQLSQSPICANV